MDAVGFLKCYMNNSNSRHEVCVSAVAAVMLQKCEYTTMIKRVFCLYCYCILLQWEEKEEYTL